MTERSNQLASVHDVADHFLLKIRLSSGDMIGNLKIQKLCYYAQAHYLQKYDAPLFSEEIEAWAHGPVVPVLYKRFRRVPGYQPLSHDDLRGNPLKKLAEQDRAFLDKIWETYGAFSAWELERMTHEDAAWKKAYGERAPGARCNEIINMNMNRKLPVSLFS